MSSLFIAALVVASVVAICVVLIRIHNKQKRKASRKMMERFRDEGVRNDLAFSSQEVLSSGVIGLDGVRRKLMFLPVEAEIAFSPVLIHLPEVQYCMLTKQFRSVTVGRKVEPYLEKINLHFDFGAQRQPVEVVFFDHFVHALSLAPELEKRASHWEMLLSKIIKKPKENPTKKP